MERSEMFFLAVFLSGLFFPLPTGLLADQWGLACLAVDQYSGQKIGGKRRFTIEQVREILIKDHLGLIQRRERTKPY